MDILDNRTTHKASSGSEVKELKIEIRKHHVTPGVNVLDLVMDIDGEKLKLQTQHQDGDPAFQKFAREFATLAKTLSEDVTFLGRSVKHG